jgi:hypothetical protein
MTFQWSSVRGPMLLISASVWAVDLLHADMAFKKPSSSRFASRA